MSQEVQQKAINTYNQNVEYLKKYQPEVYKNLELFNAAIELGQIKPNFELQYTNGYFDVLDINTKQFLYGKNSNEISKQVVENNISFEADASSFKTFYEHNYTDSVAKIALEKDVLAPYTVGNAPVVNYVNKNLPKSEMIKRIEKFIVFGIALGLHIPIIHEKLQSKVYLFVEPNLEFFRLSMFVVEYYKIATQAKLFFSIAQNQDQFRATYEAYHGELFIFNHYHKFLKFSNNADSYIQVIQNYLVSQGHYLYSYDRTFLSIFRTNIYISQDYKMLNIKNKKSLEPFKKPVLFLAAGPSLQHNIEFVRNNKDKFIIVAIYATLPILERNGIVPDVITQYDEQDIQVLNTLDKLNDISFFNDSLFIFSSHVNAKLTKSFPKDNIYFFQAMFEVKEEFGILTSPSIGELTYALLLHFNPSEIYLLGLDLALDVETGASHMEGHSGAGAFNKLKSEEESDDRNYSYRKNTIKVKGNFLPEVKTVPVFKTNIDMFANFTNLFKKEHNKVYNLSNGAYLHGTTPLEIGNFDTSSLEEFQKDILRATLFEAFNQESEAGYSNKDIENINLKLSSVKKMKKLIDTFQKTKKYKDSDEYQTNLITFAQMLIFENQHCKDLQQILLNYAQHNLHHMIHLLNIDEDKDQRRHIYELNKNFLTQINKIINTYVIAITYSHNQNSASRKKLNKFLKEYSVKETHYCEPFFKELAETAKKTLQKEHSKNSIGFFATNDNLQNKEFVTYVQELCEKIEDISLKIFYFFDIQKTSAQSVFKKELSIIEFCEPQDLLDITSKVEYWIESCEKTSNLVKVDDLILNNFDNVYSSLMIESSKKIEKEQTFKSKLINDINDKHYVSNTAYYNFAQTFKEKIYKESLLELFEEKSIGILGVKENLSKDTIKHLYEILSKFPSLKLKVFYFDEDIKNEYTVIFARFHKQLEYIISKTIHDIAKSCEIWAQGIIKGASMIHGRIMNHIQNDTLNIYPVVLNDDFKIGKSSDYKQALIEKYDEKQFSKQLNGNIDEQRLQNTNPEDNFGFLATEDNLEDKDFLKLMFILLEKHPEIKYKAFYFNEEQKSLFETIFSEFLDRFELIIPKDIYKMTENISTYIYSFIKGKKVKSQTYHKVWQVLNNVKANLFKLYLDNEINFENSFANNLNLINNSKKLIRESIILAILKESQNYMEYKLEDDLKNLIEGPIKQTFSQKSIGFLIDENNTKSRELIKYIIQLINYFPKYHFKLFYFDEKVKKNLNISFDKKNLSFIKLNSLKDIILNVEVFIWSLFNSLDLKIHAKIFRNNSEIAGLFSHLNEPLYIPGCTIDEYDSKIKDINYISYSNPKKLGFDDTYINKYKSSHTLLFYSKILSELDLPVPLPSDDAFDFYNFKIIEYIIEYPSFKKYYLELMYAASN